MSMQNPRCDVILATYNGERFVAETIDSILSQSYQNFRLLIVDDGSTDATYTMLQAYAAKFPNKVLVNRNERNLGVGLTVQKLLCMVDAPYVAWPGQDDTWSQDFLSVSLQTLSERPEISATFSKVKLVDKQGGTDVPIESPFKHEKIGSVDRDDLTFLILQGNFLCAPASVFRFDKKIAAKMIHSNDQLQDFEMWLYLSTTGAFHYDPSITTWYRVHDANVSYSSYGRIQGPVDFGLTVISFLNSEEFSSYFSALKALELRLLWMIGYISDYSKYAPLMKGYELVFANMMMQKLKNHFADRTALERMYALALLKSMTFGKYFKFESSGADILNISIYASQSKKPEIEKLFLQNRGFSFADLAKFSGDSIGTSIPIIWDNQAPEMFLNLQLHQCFRSGLGILVTEKPLYWSKIFSECLIISPSELSKETPASIRGRLLRHIQAVYLKQPSLTNYTDMRIRTIEFTEISESFSALRIMCKSPILIDGFLARHPTGETQTLSYTEKRMGPEDLQIIFDRKIQASEILVLRLKETHVNRLLAYSTAFFINGKIQIPFSFGTMNQQIGITYCPATYARIAPQLFSERHRDISSDGRLIEAVVKMLRLLKARLAKNRAARGIYKVILRFIPEP